MENVLSTIPGMILLNVLVESFESKAYANFLGIYYEDADVKLNQVYSYQIRRVMRGLEYEIGASEKITIGKAESIKPPSEIKIKLDTIKTKIYWRQKPDDFYAVDIFRADSTSPIFRKLNQSPVMVSDRIVKDTANLYHYQDVNLRVNTIYRYKFVGKDMFGEYTDYSEPFTIKVADMIPPPAPYNVSRKIKNPTVQIFWSSLKVKDLAGFHIYRATLSDGPYTQISKSLLSTRDSVYSDKVSKSGAYYYRIHAVDLSANQSISEKVFAEVHDIKPPAKPIGLVCKPDTGHITLTWKENAEPDILGYLIYRTVSKNSKDHFVLLNSNPIKGNSFVEKLPKNAKNKFLYKIVAIDSSFNKSPISDISSARMPDIFPPAAPHLLGVTPINQTLSIAWIPNADPDMHHYLIYRAIDNKRDTLFSQLNKAEISLNETNFIDKDCIKGIKYSYYMLAVDSAGNQSYRSRTIQAFIPLNDVPIAIDKKNYKIQYKKDQRKVELTWKIQPPFLATVVLRKEGSGTYIPLAQTTTLSGFNDLKIKTKNTYTYILKAFSTNGETAVSQPVEIQVE